MTFGNLTIATPPKPDALRLADALEFGAPFVVDRDLVAAELRRLHAAHEHQYAMAGLMLREAERTQRELDKVREAARMALEALEQWDGLIEHQYTGSAAAMTDMHYAAQATVPVLEALEEALGEDK